jgi:hypothetical protein
VCDVGIDAVGVDEQIPVGEDVDALLMPFKDYSERYRTEFSGLATPSFAPFAGLSGHVATRSHHQQGY